MQSDISPEESLNLPELSNDVPTELHRVQRALAAVFSQGQQSLQLLPPQAHSPNDALLDRRHVADRYLTMFQHAPVAWMVCDQMLRLDDSSTSLMPAGAMLQRRFFAAQTLHAKCRDDVHQLPVEALPSLRDSLVVHLLQYSANRGQLPPALMTRLALAVSALAVQMCWSTVVPDMLQQYVQDGADGNQNLALLDLFHVLPEEAFNERITLLDESKRMEYQKALESSVPQVMDFLAQQLHQHLQATNSQNNNLQEKVFQCVQTWLRCIKIAPQVMEHYYYLLDMAFASLSGSSKNGQMEEIESSVDVIVEFLRVYPSNHACNTGLISRTIPLVMRLQENEVHFSKQIINAPHLHYSDEEREDAEFNDRLRSYCRIFTEMSESYMSWIIYGVEGAPQDALQNQQQADKDRVVELVLKCSAIPNREVASMTLNFWFRFVHELEIYSGNNLRLQQAKIDHYLPVLVSLVQVCVANLLLYPSDIDDLRPDQLDDVERDRLYVADTIEDCCRLLGGHEVLRYLGQRLQIECQLLQQSSDRQTGYLGIEACLFALKGISRFIPNDEGSVLPFVFGEVLMPLMLHHHQQHEQQQLLQQQSGSYKPTPQTWLRQTINLLIGQYADWLAKHPSFLQPLLPYLAQGFSIRDCSSSAAMAVRQLCDFSWDPPLGEPVLQLYEQLMSLAAGGKPTSGFALDLRDELAVLEGVCKAISRDLEYNSSADASHMFNRIVTPIGNRLTSLLAAQERINLTTSLSTSSLRQVVAEIERLTVIVRYLKSPKRSIFDSGVVEPSLSDTLIVELMKQSWDLLDTVTQRHPADSNLAEKLCRLHKHAMRNCGAQVYAPLVGPFMTQLIRNFRHSYQSPYLYAASICITEFGTDPTYVPQLFHLISELSSTIFERMISLDDFTQHPDVVEEYFYLSGRFMTHCPEPLVVSPFFRKIIQRAVIGLHIHHREANKGTLNFLENTVAFGLNIGQSAVLVSEECKAAFQEAIIGEGPAIVHNLAHALLGDLPSYSLDHGSGSVAGVLWKLNALCPNLVHEWIRPAVSRAPEPAKSDLMAAMTRMAGREEFNGVVRHFKTSCDRTRRMRSSVGAGRQA